MILTLEVESTLPLPDDARLAVEASLDGAGTSYDLAIELAPGRRLFCLGGLSRGQVEALARECRAALEAFPQPETKGD